MTSDETRETTKAAWNFEPIGPNGYEEEGIPAFEVFNQQQGLDPLEVLVREAIQNSCDAAEESIVEISFDLRELQGAAADRFLEVCGLDTLKPHLEGTASQEGTLQDRIENDGIPQVANSVLRVMTVADHGTVGLWGEEGLRGGADGNFHRLARAAMKTHEEGTSTKGGSFGLGKAIYWMMSGIASVVLYSIPIKDHKAGEHRLIGRSWLPSHTTKPDSDEDEYWNNVGGWFGASGANEKGQLRSVSLWGQDAATVAGDLGILRDNDDFGTSIVILAFDDPDQPDEPDVEATCAKLLNHVIKWYWPALQRGLLKVSISGSVDDEVVFPKADATVSESDPVVGGFVAAWKNLKEDSYDSSTWSFASEILDWTIPERTKKPAHPEQTVNAVVGIAIQDSVADDDLANSVALMRGATGMVVDYYRKGTLADRFTEMNQSFYGVLVTGSGHGDTDEDSHLEMFLRAAEPPAHDRWEYSQERVRQAYRTKAGGGKVTARMALSSYYESIDAFLRKQLLRQDEEEESGRSRLERLVSFGNIGGKKRNRRPKLTISRGRPRHAGGEWSFEGASYGFSGNSGPPAGTTEWSFKIGAVVPEGGRRSAQSLEALEIKSISITEGEATVADGFSSGDIEAKIKVKGSTDRVRLDIVGSLPGEQPGGRTSRTTVSLVATSEFEEESK